MLLPGLGSVRIVKNYDLGSPRSQFFTIRTDPKPDNNMFIFFCCGKLACKWVCLCNFVAESAYAPSANDL